jgi:hypothetical protein
MANPRGLRASSGNSRPTVTVEKRTNTGVFSPTVERKFAFVRPATSLVHSKYPKAPEPHGWTIRSRFFDRLKCCCFWNRNTSLARGRPPMVLLCALPSCQHLSIAAKCFTYGSGKGMPSLFVKYGPSSLRIPPWTDPETFAMMSAGPSLELIMWLARGARPSPDTAPWIAMAVACNGCCIGSFWFVFALVIDGAIAAFDLERRSWGISML